MKKYDSITKQFLIKEYIQNKKSLHQIADLFDGCKSTIYNKMKRFNILRRTKKDSTKLTTQGKDNSMFGRKGILCPSYIDGRSKDLYPLEFNFSLRETIRKRDNYTCQKCGIIEEEYLVIYGRILGVHHIDYNKENCDKNNLITLCNQCNCRANYNRDYWYSYFKYIITEVIQNG